MDRIDFILISFIIFVVLILFLVPIIYYIRKYEILISSKVSDDNTGILFIKNIRVNNIPDTSKYVYYNIPEVGISGYIGIDINNMNTKQLDKVIKKLKAWGEKEKLKHARMKAYESLDVKGE